MIGTSFLLSWWWRHKTVVSWWSCFFFFPRVYCGFLRSRVFLVWASPVPVWLIVCMSRKHTRWGNPFAKTDLHEPRFLSCNVKDRVLFPRTHNTAQIWMTCYLDVALIDVLAPFPYPCMSLIESLYFGGIFHYFNVEFENWPHFQLIRDIGNM